MDIQLPEIGGLEAAKKIIQGNADIKILILTIHPDKPYPSRLLQAGGVAGYITKGCTAKEMIRAIPMIHSGQHYLSSDIGYRLELKNSCNPGEFGLDILSERELEITLMILNGQDIQEISDKLHINQKTVNSYRYRIFKKLGIDRDEERLF